MENDVKKNEYEVTPEENEMENEVKKDEEVTKEKTEVKIDIKQILKYAALFGLGYFIGIRKQRYREPKEPICFFDFHNHDLNESEKNAIGSFIKSFNETCYNNNLVLVQDQKKKHSKYTSFAHINKN